MWPRRRSSRAVAATGMSAVPWKAPGSKAEDARHRREQAFFTTASGACVLLGLILHVWLSSGLEQAWKLLGAHAGQPMPWPEVALISLRSCLVDRFVIVKAWHAARTPRPDMNLQMMVAVLGAMVIGEWFEGATVSFLFALSLMLESWSVARASRAITALLELAPSTVRLLRADGKESDVPVAEVRGGDHFKEAHARRSPAEQWAKRFARVYTPAVMLLALVVFLVRPLVFGAASSEWFYRALVLLVIACPCALVISTPVSIVAALAAAARAGVLVKGGAFVELPARLQAIAMDKTGTITFGKPEVADIIPLKSHTEVELLARATALARSTHYAERNNIAPTPATDVKVLRAEVLLAHSTPRRSGSVRTVMWLS